MKTKGYLAIHHSIGLSLSIGRHTQNFKTIKPLLHKLCIKIPAFTRYFTFKVPASAQVLASSCKTLGKLNVHIYTLR